MSFSSVAAAAPQRGWGSPVPSPLSPLIGRRQELATAAAMLRRGTTRLLTLTGPGGIGKTRLALEIAAEVAPDFDDGVVWVSLAPVHDTAVIATIAASIGITGVAVGDRLVRALRESRLLLVLDNFEHVVEAAPQVAELLEACPTLQVLVTSRSRLRIRGERILPVPPLSRSASRPESVIPGGESQPPAPLTLHSEAVTLFIERAQALVPNIDVSEANAAVVAEICQRLDGLPLAIELAAARVSHLPLQTLLQRMDQRLPLLVDGDRDLPVRLQTMRNAIAWSYDLLTPAEQSLFRYLGMFDGGFTLEAAEAVGGSLRSRGEEGGRFAPGGGGENEDREASVDDHAPSSSPCPPFSPSSPSGRQAAPLEHSDPPQRSAPLPVLDLIASLIEKSLIRHDPDAPGSPRYAMLETVREYALERLASTGETPPSGLSPGQFGLRGRHDRSNPWGWGGTVRGDSDRARAGRPATADPGGPHCDPGDRGGRSGDASRV